MHKKNILITGNMGYVGSVIVPYLKKKYENLNLIGFDAAYFAHSLTGADIVPEAYLSKQYFGDLRNFDKGILNNVDGIVHLGAISNDPMGFNYEEVTKEINLESSKGLIGAAIEMGVQHFVFASSCSIYGQSEGASRKESDIQNPLTMYARSKVAVEQYFEDLNLSEMCVTCLRFATACGMSPRLRLDLVLNDFVAGAILNKKISILSDGSPWRPLINVEDMALAIEWALNRSSSDGGQILRINTGSNGWNFQIHQLAQIVAEVIPGVAISINKNAQLDKRSYKVDFTKFSELAPSFNPQKNIRETIMELSEGLAKTISLNQDFRNSSLIRLKTLEMHIEDRRLNKELRWTS